MRIIQTNSPIETMNLHRYYLDYHQVMARCGVGRATAYRYMAKAPEETKILVRPLKRRPVTMVMIVAIDRIHKAAKPGNPNMRKTP